MVNSTRQQTLSTTVARIIDQDSQRTGYSICNLDSSIIVYISTQPDVSSTSGYPIYPKQSVSFVAAAGDNTVVQRFGIAASGTPIIAIDEEYARS